MVVVLAGVALVVALLLWTSAYRRRLAREDVLAQRLALELAEAFGVEGDEAEAIVRLARFGSTD